MLRDGGLLAVEGFEGFFGEGFEGFFGEGIERLGFLGDRVLKGGEVGGEGDKEVGAFGENGFLRFEFVEELLDLCRHWRVLRLSS